MPPRKPSPAQPSQLPSPSSTSMSGPEPWPAWFPSRIITFFVAYDYFYDRTGATYSDSRRGSQQSHDPGQLLTECAGFRLTAGTPCNGSESWYQLGPRTPRLFTTQRGGRRLHAHAVPIQRHLQRHPAGATSSSITKAMESPSYGECSSNTYYSDWNPSATSAAGRQ